MLKLTVHDHPPLPASDGEPTRYADYQRVSFRSIQPDYEAWAERALHPKREV